MLKMTLVVWLIVATSTAFQFIGFSQANALEGIRNLRPVLNNVMYRGGGPGGKRQLSEAGLQSLCQAGFSSAVYLYKEGFQGTRTVECIANDGTRNRLTYESISFRKGRYEILSKVRSVIVNPSKGPVFVHCWNGMHAAGEIAAVALKQFCDYSSEQASKYWVTNIWDNPNDYKSIWMKHIPNFTPYEDLKISSSLQSDLCP